MKIVTLVVCLLALAGPLAAQDTPQAPAPAASTPTRVMPGAKIYIDPAGRVRYGLRGRCSEEEGGRSHGE
ncbi:MAG: hypothetical protein EHM24_21385 [Acidobacteria bacterium]|nr:MAG: hypothetical protein EHM24_21385 [Acidobacteriota bacterium]